MAHMSPRNCTSLSFVLFWLSVVGAKPKGTARQDKLLSLMTPQKRSLILDNPTCSQELT